MKQKCCSLVAVVVFAILSAPALAQAPKPANSPAAKKGSFDLAAARNAIDASNQQFGRLMAAGDSAGLVAMYHSEAMVYPPNMPSGNRNVMGSIVKMLPGMGIKTATLRSTEVVGDENMLVETGSFEMGDGSKTVDKGKYMVVWKQEDGTWKMYRDMWNSDAPATGQ
jgi:ketosteroid isomerase-like protein